LEEVNKSMASHKQIADGLVRVWKSRFEKAEKVLEECHAMERTQALRALTEENSRLKQTLLEAATEQMLMEQELCDAQHIIGTYEADTADAGVQTVEVATATLAVQADAAAAHGFFAPERPTESRVVRRSAALGITGLAHEVVPEGVGPESVDTRVLGIGLLKPTVRSRWRMSGCPVSSIRHPDDLHFHKPAHCSVARALCFDQAVRRLQDPSQFVRDDSTANEPADSVAQAPAAPPAQPDIQVGDPARTRAAAARPVQQADTLQQAQQTKQQEPQQQQQDGVRGSVESKAGSTPDAAPTLPAHVSPAATRAQSHSSPASIGAAALPEALHRSAAQPPRPAGLAPVAVSDFVSPDGGLRAPAPSPASPFMRTARASSAAVGIAPQSFSPSPLMAAQARQGQAAPPARSPTPSTDQDSDHGDGHNQNSTALSGHTWRRELPAGPAPAAQAEAPCVPAAMAPAAPVEATVVHEEAAAVDQQDVVMQQHDEQQRAAGGDASAGAAATPTLPELDVEHPWQDENRAANAIKCAPPAHCNHQMGVPVDAWVPGVARQDILTSSFILRRSST
jgi:hypothetical protein